MISLLVGVGVVIVFAVIVVAAAVTRLARHLRRRR